MDDGRARLSYEDLVREFKLALNRALVGGTLPAVTVLADVPLTLALLDICHAAQNHRPTQYLVSRACAAFADFAHQQEREMHSATTDQVATRKSRW